MSYRSFKRVLGETNLERKCRFLFGGCLLLLISLSFFWYGRQTEKLVYEQNSATCKLLVDLIITRIHWEKNDTRDDERFLAENLAEQFSKHPYKHTFLKPPERGEGGARPGDEFEWKAWQNFLADKEAAPMERRVPEKQEYQYFQPIRASHQSCIDCHRSQNLGQIGAVGDLMAVVKVVIPDGPTQGKLNGNRAILISTAIITVFLAMVASYVIVRYVIAKPLRHLKEVSDAISHGNIEKRAEIRTGDEFEELGRAFNRMLRHLVAVQQELRQVNSDLDGKVDELAQANMALFEMNRLKSEFMANMSHELRTPLNHILGFSDVLASAENLDDRQKKFVRNIQKSGKTLLELINDVLDLSKIESGRMELRLSEFRIDHVAAAQADLFRRDTEKKNIDLEVEVDPDLPAVYQDQGKVQQIFQNLLSNAVKFTPEGGRIKVGVGQPADRSQILLVVADTGVGIADEDQEIVFEKFRQGRTVAPSGNGMTREYSGTGLGLSIVKELCKLMGGSISLKSELGKGSTFSVRLPAVMRETQRGSVSMADPLIDLNKGRRIQLDRRSPASLAAPRAD